MEKIVSQTKRLESCTLSTLQSRVSSWLSLDVESLSFSNTVTVSYDALRRSMHEEMKSSWISTCASTRRSRNIYIQFMSSKIEFLSLRKNRRPRPHLCSQLLTWFACSRGPKLVKVSLSRSMARLAISSLEHSTSRQMYSRPISSRSSMRKARRFGISLFSLVLTALKKRSKHLS